MPISLQFEEESIPPMNLTRSSQTDCRPRRLLQCSTGHSGYNLARVRFELIFAPTAVSDLRSLPSHQRSEVRDAIETHLRFEPEKLSRSRIKRLRGLGRPQFRLRVGEIRVFYDVTESAVEILAIVSKAQADGWLKAEGTSIPIRGAGEGEG